MKTKIAAVLATAAFTVPAFADSHASGDAAAGEKAFRQCKSCHMIASDDETIVKGGKTGPNLYGIFGRAAGSVDGYKFSDLVIAAGETGLEWDEEAFVGFVQDPTSWLKEYTGGDGRSKMTFKVRKEEDAVNLWTYLVSVGPDS